MKRTLSSILAITVLLCMCLACSGCSDKKTSSADSGDSIDSLSETSSSDEVSEASEIGESSMISDTITSSDESTSQPVSAVSSVSSAVSSRVSSSTAPVSSATSSAVSSSGSSIKGTTIDMSAAKYKFQGRTMADGKGITMDWTCSGVEFNASCQGAVALNFNMMAKQDIYFTVFVDGVQQARMKLAPTGEQTLVIATGLAKGTHSFRVYRQSENNEHGQATLKSITLDGTMLDAPKNADMYVEFYGDSLTAGYGNLATKQTENGHISQYEDGYQSYASITARNLSADWSIVAEAGIGMVKGYIKTPFPEIFEYTNWVRSKTVYGFSRKADVVVINLGTNDSFFIAADSAKFTTAVKDLITSVRAKHPNAKIVWALGMMNDIMKANVQGAIAELGGAAKSIYYCALPANTAGGVGHSNVEGDKAAADALTKFIKGIL